MTLCSALNRSSIDKGPARSDSLGRNQVMIITVRLNLIHQATERINLLQDEKLSSFLISGEVTSRSTVKIARFDSINSAGAVGASTVLSSLDAAVRNVGPPTDRVACPMIPNLGSSDRCISC
ncbi:unnamed protein product [Echinostoma caproni]|uniref:Uncharacterized protein n=1 Tax=Echinostoma caproni TaxID=27848 RepID=A0A183A0Z1_9TREM|nr:unnamed protein product [Echinostoma caproni]